MKMTRIQGSRPGDTYYRLQKTSGIPVRSIAVAVILAIAGLLTIAAFYLY